MRSLLFSVKQWIFKLPIITRVFIGNSLVILIGAVFGTLITRQMALIGNLRLIFIFASFGIMLTLLVNYWIIRTALLPLDELRYLVGQVKEGQTDLRGSWMLESDPDIHPLTVAINSMLSRLNRRTLQLKALSERAINAQEEERKRIARGLHDETAQSISMLIIQLEQLEKMLPVGDAVTRRLIGIRQMAIQMLDDLRKNIWDLRPSILDDLGLVPAIRWYARTHLEKEGIAVHLETPSESIRLPNHIETILFRISQEGITNILRHAQAQSVTIRLQQQVDQACLELEDDGKGFDVEKVTGDAITYERLGLIGIEERASLLGGKVLIHSQPGKGTSLKVAVPLLEDNLPAPRNMRTQRKGKNG